MSEENTYPDGTEIHNRDEVTINVSGIVYRRMVGAFEELDRQLRGRLEEIERTHNPDALFERYTNSDIFKDYTADYLREMAERSYKESRDAVEFIRNHYKAALHEIHSTRAVTVKADPNPNSPW